MPEGLTSTCVKAIRAGEISLLDKDGRRAVR
jgi:hypothetical protein